MRGDYMRIGFLELIVIVGVALIVFGPDKMPEFARTVGKALKELKSVTGELSKEMKESIAEPLEEIQKPIKEITAPLTDIKKEFDNSIKDVTDSFNQIGKSEPEKKQAQPKEIENVEIVKNDSQESK